MTGSRALGRLVGRQGWAAWLPCVCINGCCCACCCRVACALATQASRWSFSLRYAPLPAVMAVMTRLTDAAGLPKHERARVLEVRACANWTRFSLTPYLLKTDLLAGTTGVACCLPPAHAQASAQHGQTHRMLLC